MKLQSFVLAVLASSVVVSASNPLTAGHSRLARRNVSAAKSRSIERRCKAREPPKASTTVDSGNNFAAVASPSPDNGNKNDDKNNNNDNNSGNSNNNHHSNSGSGSSVTAGMNNAGAWVNSLLSIPSACGDGGATFDVTSISGPNGNIDYFNCGIDGSGWNPPHITVDHVQVADLAEALKKDDSPFHACSQFTDFFYKYGGEYGIHPIILASFAMQESSCNPATVGGAGEQGLMQLTHDKCGDAPGGNCQDPDYNIKTGARYFSQTLSSNGGNLLLAIGSYNGWFEGMTYGQATAAGSTSCCRCQNNLDYLQQFLNGWCQNINAYSWKLGKYFNLDHC